MLIDFRQLFPKYGISPKGVLHIGANVGEEAPVYNELGIKKVIWIEGNPEIYQKLESNISPYDGQIALNYCIGDEDKETVLHISNNGSQSSSVLALGTHKIQHPEVHYTHDIPVSMQRLDSIFTREEGGPTSIGLDFLNIDLQGAELMALRGMGDLLNEFKWAYLEVNKERLYEGCPLVEDLDMFLMGFGFRRAETRWCGNTGWGDALYIKK
jgi:FkbM family methyltransferase